MKLDLEGSDLKTLPVILIGSFAALAALAAPPAATTVTFNKDVLPILQKNCQQCHRPGEVAPMSLLTYESSRPWAKAIKASVVARKMPPWFAEVGHFQDERVLSQGDIAKLVAWADNGAPEGDAKDKPAPVTFPEGWQVKPDLVVEMPEPFHVPAKGTINYQFIRVKGNIDRDLWVQAAEMRPGDNRVLHHGKVWVVPPGSKWMADAEYGKPYEAQEGGRNTADDGNDILGKFNPGLGAQEFSVDGSAKFVPKGSDFVFEMHYTAVGTPVSDTSRLGIVLAKNPPTRRYYLSAGPTASNLSIPPGDGNAEVVSEVTVGFDNVNLVYAQPHMHLRGKDFELRVIYPTGEQETVFRGKFDFEWQLGYNFAKPYSAAQGHPRDRNFALRQLGQQQVQSRSQ
jgi:hypothetical protein